MKLKFYKYQGTGNDFVIIDNRSLEFPKENKELITHLCDRRFGIGGDGLMLLENHAEYDFTMVYYNSDGSTSTMCGNGGRCLVAFANFLGIVKNEAHFEASDGYHYAKIENDLVYLQMIDVEKINIEKNYQFVYTGSPHHVLEVNNLEEINIKDEGSKIRYSGLYGEAGANINFVSQMNSNSFLVRTYERGVEDETLSCGTGVTAVAIAMHEIGRTNSNSVILKVKGGDLRVTFDYKNQHYTNVFLIGPAIQVFSGEIEI